MTRAKNSRASFFFRAVGSILRMLKPKRVLILEFVNPFYGLGIRGYRKTFSSSTRSPVYLCPFPVSIAPCMSWSKTDTDRRDISCVGAGPVSHQRTSGFEHTDTFAVLAIRFTLRARNGMYFVKGKPPAGVHPYGAENAEPIGCDGAKVSP